MSFLSTHFDYDVVLSSPVVDDFERLVKYDKDGNEFITFVKVDYPAVQARNGLSAVWTLNSLLKSGVDPAFPVHTGNPTRLEGVSIVQEFSEVADSILSEVESINVE